MAAGCTFYAMDGFSAAGVPLALLALDADAELRRAYPELHARLTVVDASPHAPTTTEDDGARCTYEEDVVTLFVEGEFDGADALALRRDGRFVAGATYFVMSSRRRASQTFGTSRRTRESAQRSCREGEFDGADALALRRDGRFLAGATYFVMSSRRRASQSFRTDLTARSAILSGDGKTLVTVESEDGVDGCASAYIANEIWGAAGAAPNSGRAFVFVYRTAVSGCVLSQRVALSESGARANILQGVLHQQLAVTKDFDELVRARLPLAVCRRHEAGPGGALQR
jgi:hypothetical protein